MLGELTIEDVIAEQGILQQALPGYRFRQVQLEMAKSVEQGIAEQSTQVIEAATGTGKTFAYLIPAILSGKKILISTGTKNLQDQLFNKDLPLLRKLLKIPFKAALLKGRNNYLCQYRIELNQDAPDFADRSLQSELYKIKLWQAQVTQGDIAELKFIPENSKVWPLVTSTKDNCLGQECDFFQTCFLQQARKKAMEADIIVINHHLFFADQTLKEHGFGELLPKVDATIFDEAHQLPEIASDYLGQRLSSRQLLELINDVHKEITSKALHTMLPMLDTLQQTLSKMRHAMGSGQARKPWRDICYKPELVAALEALKSALKTLVEQLANVSGHSKGLSKCFERSEELWQLLLRITQSEQQDNIYWFETFIKNFSLHLTPLNLAKEFKRIFAEDQAWVFTSATLSMNQDFSFFRQRMGLAKNTSCTQLATVFDYPNQARLFLPPNLPQPSEPNFYPELLKAVLPVINDFKGRTFFLFTSYHGLNQVAQALQQDHPEFYLCIQGHKPKQRLIDEFCEHPMAILLGTHSFWEGVDVKGEALSCVIIDKLPFASPADPVLQARIQVMRKNGWDPFTRYQLPQAAISLKQGVGRLIRCETDTGVIILGDPRLQTKAYGKQLLAALPTMGRLE